MAFQMRREEVVKLAISVQENLDHLTNTEWESKVAVANWVKRLIKVEKASTESIYRNVRDIVQQLGGVLRLKSTHSPVSLAFEKINMLEQRLNKLEKDVLKKPFSDN